MFSDNIQEYSSKKVSCPYNPSHQFQPNKYVFHINKCKDKAKKAHLFATCKYNSNHIILKQQIQSHYLTCEFAKGMAPAIEQLSEAMHNQPPTTPKISASAQMIHDNQDCQEIIEDPDQPLSECEDCLAALSTIKLQLYPKLIKQIKKYFDVKKRELEVKRQEKRKLNATQNQQGPRLKKRKRRKHKEPQQMPIPIKIEEEIRV